MNAIRDWLLPALDFLVSEPERTGPLEILLVEDNSVDLDLITPGLLGHRLHIYKNFAEARAALDNMANLDAAFVDLNIAGGHGMEIVNYVAVRFPSAKVAVVCGSAEPMRPGDKALVIMKSGRIAKDLQDFLKNGNGHSVNRKRLYFLLLVAFTLVWLAGRERWFEQIAKYLSP